VLARFSRLLADPNRPEDSEELVRATADGRPIAINRGLDAAERARRVELWRSYHRAVDGTLAAHHAALVFAVHSFTPLYEGQPRHLEIGILFDEEEALAHHVRDALAAAGFAVELNEPYSGREGLIYSAHRHAEAHGRRALEIEVRQDLCVDDAFRARLVDALAFVPGTADRPSAR
jgi:predicted N-formylglutamate amidohydrolase